MKGEGKGEEKGKWKGREGKKKEKEKETVLTNIRAANSLQLYFLLFVYFSYCKFSIKPNFLTYHISLNAVSTRNKSFAALFSNSQ